MHTITRNPPAARPARRRARRVLLALAVATALAAGLTPAASAGTTASAGVRIHDGRVDLPIGGGTATIDPATLGIVARTGDGRALTVSGPAAGSPGRPEGVSRSQRGAQWSYPGRGLHVEAHGERGRLLVSVTSDRDGTLSWPVTGADPAAVSLQLPRGEGLSLPVGDPFWNSDRARLAGSTEDMASQLTLPVWGYTLRGGRGVSYLTPTDIGTSLAYASPDGRLHTTAEHAFSQAGATGDYTVAFSLTDGSAVAPATDYRHWLSEHGALGSLAEKIRENPETGRLLGAFHAYAWGGARRAPAIEHLTALGVSRLWLGYDADEAPMGSEDVAAARRAGYLVGPYDSFANGRAKGPDTPPNSVWPDGVYPSFCVRRADGTPQPGFRNQGCYLSSQAFEQAEPQRHYLADRTRALVANGANSYFLDVDAAGELFRDHDAAHPMTMAQDRANRLARMRRLTDGTYGPTAGRRVPLVLGSEAAGSWAQQVLAFDHGSGTVVDGRLWPMETGHFDTAADRPKDDTAWGGYTPAAAPDTFFKPVRVDDFKPEHRAEAADALKAMYDPAYRVPLYETALHGSLVNVERWELPFGKLPDEKTNRALLAMLYNTPLNFVLSDQDPRHAQNEHELAVLQQYFAPLHQAAGTRELTSFAWLTPDRAVQRTVFGDGTLTVTANFGTTAHAGLPGGCVDATLKGGAARRLCPAQVVS
ncbi:glycoside hydrolase [Streptomyces sp. NBC_00083]|uniref:glycoside hydrolase n=1 Tax=Streptomyces sp. NBC_00083 TaxID=2975647 RepID=UPI00225399EA|nr:glycoside hydrolase [Streptomyces sp. NBC_00083]MCX5384269.1 glycoside hydrolase [Streptomyces sp. NBC_00083]